MMDNIIAGITFISSDALKIFSFYQLTTAFQS